MKATMWSRRKWIIGMALVSMLLTLGGLPGTALGPTARAVGGDALRDRATQRGVLIGAAVATTPFIDGEAAYRDTLKTEYNSLVAENMMKWHRIHPGQNTYDWGPSDALVGFVEANGMKVRGHTLVWHASIPDWVKTGNFSTQQLKDILESHIKTVVGRYKGRIHAWDVVNEAISDGGGYRTDSFWYQKLGPDYIKWAFQWAHEADPSAILYYNDYGAEGLGTKSDSVYNLVRDLKNAGVPVEGVGWQMHFETGWRASTQYRQNAYRIRDLGLELSMTEIDFRIASPTTSEKLAAQATSYRDALDLCLSLSNCKAFLTWGFTDKYSWIPRFFGGSDDALIFDRNYQPKPAYFALRDGLSDFAPDPNTDYRIRSVHSGKALDISGISVENGARLQQWDYAGQGNQKFRFESLGNGDYWIRAVHSQKCLDVVGVSLNNGARIQQYDCLWVDNQRWRLQLSGSEVSIIAKHSGRVLDVSGWSQSNGARIIQYDNFNQANQRWIIDVAP